LIDDRPSEEANDGRELRRLAVETALASTFKDLRNPYITWEDLKQLVVVSMPDHVRARWWFDEIRNYRDGGGDLPPRTFPRIEMLQDELLVAVCERVNLTDPLTIIAAMNYNSQIYFNFNDFNPEIFIKPFQKHNGILVQASGLMGSGKTDFALRMAEILLDYKFVVITNIKCKEAHRVIRGQVIPGKIDNLYMVTRMTDLLLQCIEMRKQNRNVVIIFDETSIFYNRQSASTRENIAIGVFLRLIRKFSSSCVLIEQIDRGLSSIADNLLVGRYHKISKKKLHYSTSTLEKNYNLFLENTPPTRIKFDTLDFAGFNIDIDFKVMMEEIDIDSTSKVEEIENYVRNKMMIDELGRMPVKAMQKVSKIKRKKSPSTNNVVQRIEKKGV